MSTPPFIVGVLGIVIRGDGQVLALRRHARVFEAQGRWETVAGKVEHGEDPFDAVVREITEETGLQVDVDPRPLDAWHATRDGVPMILIAYRATPRTEAVVLSTEHDQAAWLTSAEFAARSPHARVAALMRSMEASHDSSGLGFQGS